MTSNFCGIIEVAGGAPLLSRLPHLAKQIFGVLPPYNSFEPAKRRFAGFLLWKTFRKICKKSIDKSASVCYNGSIN